ncbi:LytTR family DNA-binding domain-containing protein [Roseivirga sp.]|uniref:LytR/AlgR family response regulator transcription factor n=1 Tax=Roseivirga sp. TaxID=1964215 RepID=UPI002B27C1C5|nr:LytTR family DNA-binding domain-containing protein [Roseivirga sp.]
MIKCLIVDDEPLSRDVLKAYCTDHPDLEITAICKDAFEAMNALGKSSVDLIFLDVNMPKLSGINFYKSLNQKPMVVFTTAYPEFAVEGFELDATDYLLKPFSFERFVKAVNKVKEKSINQTEKDEKYILLKADRKVYKVDFSEILFFEALGDYVKAHLQDKVLIVTTTLKKLMEELPASAFMRTHKSFIIAKSKIEYLEGNQIQLALHKIPIGQAYREEVLKKLEG